jgi:hypothetical protein
MAILENDFSPAELMLDVLTVAAIGAEIVVGPANDAQQQSGAVSIVDAGLPITEAYLPIVWVRTQLRCLAGDLSTADVIARRVYAALNGKVRTTATMSSTGDTYLIHLMNVTAGPTMHYDSPETWETLSSSRA